MRRRSKEEISKYMSKIRSKNTKIELKLEEILKSLDIDYVKHADLFGTPDFIVPELKIAIFADSNFWHGFNWEDKKKEFKKNRDFWIRKIEKNILRDEKVTCMLKSEGWCVIRLWGHEIRRHPNKCRKRILNAINSNQKG